MRAGIDGKDGMEKYKTGMWVEKKKRIFLANDLSLERKQRGQSKRITTSPVKSNLESSSNKSVRIYPPTSSV